MRDVLGPMLSRPLILFSMAFLFFAMIYTAAFNVAVHTDITSAQSRFDILRNDNRPKPAARYGKRIISMREKDGENENTLAPLKAQLAETYVAARNFRNAAVYYGEALSTPWAKSLDSLDRAVLEDHLARALIADRSLKEGVKVYAVFLRRSGDHAAGAVGDQNSRLEDFYADSISKAARHFADALRPMGNPEYFDGNKTQKLAAALDMTELGAFYSTRSDDLYAAAGLLATAYTLRRETLGGNHEGTVQAALLLGPVYRKLGRLKDAETIYLEAFHAQEKAKGSNSPELSLYIRLLAGIYEEQGRATEAQALYVHIRDLFQDAFGAQRYSANRGRDRSLDVDRPVSQYFLLDADYKPKDLVKAALYSIPLSKPPNIDEMKLRLAADIGDQTDPREENLPARLAQLMSLCQSETGEHLSLRSGFRSYQTQHALHVRLAHRGTVVPAGMSEHQLGLAADIDVSGRLMRQSDQSFRCFEENAFRFGFILTYPPGNDYLPTNDSFEPWHWRYVGIQTARLYREAGPLNKPQEFLAALTCYEDRAAAGNFAIAGEPDVCLIGSAKDDKKLADTGRAGSDVSALTPTNLISASTKASVSKLRNGGR
ncbi:MAG: D-alanyl-D-alanine carboxypeptidase family protein [Pseudomonadota bacterium]